MKKCFLISSVKAFLIKSFKSSRIVERDFSRKMQSDGINNLLCIVYSFQSVRLMRWGTWIWKWRSSKHEWILTVMDAEWVGECYIKQPLENVYASVEFNEEAIFFSFFPMMKAILKLAWKSNGITVTEMRRKCDGAKKMEKIFFEWVKLQLLLLFFHEGNEMEWSLWEY